jgi:hypothetical protein
VGQLYDDEYPIVLEAEPAGYSPMAERRLAFYARFGLTVQPFDYRQPPYGADLPWVDLHLLSNRSLQEADFLRIQQEIHRQVYRISSDK